MNVVSHNCPSCGSILNFNPSSQNWLCNFCKVEYNLDMLNVNIDKYNSIKPDELDEYECSNCGAKVVTDKNTSSTTCNYCNSSVILKKSLTDEYKPDYIIPFSKTKEEIIDIFIKHLQAKRLSSKSFSNVNNIKSITSLYVPFWLVSCEVMASIRGSIFGGESGNGAARKYMRMGKMKLDKVPADGKSNLNDELLKGIEPFDYSKLLSFEYPYLAGCFAEKFDQGKEQVYKERLKEQIKDAVTQKLTDTVKGYNNGKGGNVETTNFFSDDIEYKYALVPVWFIKLEYEGKVYEYCINDSTGKISGKYQIDKTRSMFCYLVSLIISLLVGLIIGAIIGYQAAIIYSALTALISFTFILGIINSYKKIKVTHKTIDYIKEGTFDLMEKEDISSF